MMKTMNMNTSLSCSDCGKAAGPLTAVCDPHTMTRLTLCPQCLLAFHQRLHMPPGCCS